MFFYLSKALWLIAQPASLILLLLLVAFIFGFRRKRGLSQVCVALAVAILFACAFTSLGYLALRPLEETFRRPLPGRRTSPASLSLAAAWTGKSMRCGTVTS